MCVYVCVYVCVCMCVCVCVCVCVSWKIKILLKEHFIYKHFLRVAVSFIGCSLSSDTS